MLLLRLQLFWAFFKIGLFAVGGGLASIPFLRDLGHDTQWFSDDILTTMIALSQSTPGPLGINMATFIGFSTSGFAGSLFATIGLVAPSVIIILSIAKLLKTYQDAAIVQYIFFGLRAGSVALILAAGLGIAKGAFLSETGLFDLFYLPAIGLGILLIFLMWLGQKRNLHPIVYLVIASIIGAIFKL